jgi:enoyl-CoA hydratase/carnithine racemase
MYKTIKVEQDGAIDWLTLNRPDRLNAITGTMVRELWEYFRSLELDYSRRVVLMRGAGSGFCAGLDIKARTDPAEELPKPSGKGPSPSLSAIVKLMRHCPQPVIALVHGPACGGGLALALAADVRIAGTSARMNDAFIKLGISGCELGLSYFLPRMVGLSVTSELMLTGRFVDAKRALAVGLVSEVTEDDRLEQVGRALAADMLRATPLGLRKTKETLNLALKLNELDAVLDLEEHTQLACMESGGDFEEAMKAFIEKREPKFAM